MSTISSGTTSTTTLIHSGDTTGSLVFKTNDTGSGGTTAMTINTSQQVGIGNTSPALLLSVGSSTTRGLAGVLGNSTGAGTPRFTLDNTAASGGKNWGLYSGNTAVGNFDISNITDGLTTLTINSNANVILSGGTTSASGIGVTFPATQSASSDANCLDDYEEGTFSPVMSFGGASVGITYSAQQGA